MELSNFNFCMFVFAFVKCLLDITFKTFFSGWGDEETVLSQHRSWSRGEN